MVTNRFQRLEVLTHGGSALGDDILQLLVMVLERELGLLQRLLYLFALTDFFLQQLLFGVRAGHSSAHGFACDGDSQAGKDKTSQRKEVIESELWPIEFVTRCYEKPIRRKIREDDRQERGPEPARPRRQRHRGTLNRE